MRYTEGMRRVVASMSVALAGLVLACTAFSGEESEEPVATPTPDGGRDAVEAGSGDGGTATELDGAVGPLPPIAGEAGAASCASRASCVIFVTNTSFVGTSLGGVAGADAKCVDAAAGAGLSGRAFRAWISDGTQAPSSPTNNFTRANKPYVTTAGTVIATSWDDLVDGTLASPLVWDQSGGSAGGAVWTGVLSNGAAGSPHCEGWTVGGVNGEGLVGAAGAVNGTWSGGQTLGCKSSARLYCLEQ